jgi:cytochrome c peroxidase
MEKRSFLAAGFGVLIVLWALPATVRLSPIEALGKRLFFDRSLSAPAGQECAVCHGPEVGYTGPS